MKSVLIFKKALGVNNAIAANRLTVNFDTGETELVSGYNVAIGLTGNIYRRNGLTATARTEDIHSLYCGGGDAFFVYLNALYRLNKDYSADGVTNLLTVGLPMAYQQIADRTYYTNGKQKGYIVDGVGYPWIADTYVGPVTHRIFSDPPLGNKLTYLNGRIYIASGRIGWYSESFAYGWFDLAANYIDFGQKIRMWRAVNTGIFVGLERNVIFLEGTSPQNFTWKVVSSSPVVENSDVYASNIQLGKNTLLPSADSTLNSVIWTSHDGIYIGQPSGNITNITDNKLVIPKVAQACAVYGNNEYIVQFK